MVQDYSGIAKAGEIQGQMYAQMGKDVAGAIGSGTEMYGKVKQFKGQQEAFGKSMDYMAKAFPDRADMFTSAKSAVFDPNSNMIQQAAAMQVYQGQFDMINSMRAAEQTMQLNQEKLAIQRMNAGGGGTGGEFGTLPKGQ